MLYLGVEFHEKNISQTVKHGGGLTMRVGPVL